MSLECMIAAALLLAPIAGSDAAAAPPGGPSAPARRLSLSPRSAAPALGEVEAPAPDPAPVEVEAAPGEVEAAPGEVEAAPTPAYFGGESSDEPIVRRVDPAEEPPRIRRRWGIGTLLVGGAVGGGWLFGEAVVEGPLRFGTELGIAYPTVEVQGFWRNGHSIDVSVPLGDSLVAGALTGIWLFGFDIFYSVNRGRGRVRQIVGPGLGVMAGGAGGIATGMFRVPVEIGVEVLTRRHRWGFKALARPYFQVGGVGAGGVRVGSVGGGMIAGVGFSRYGVTRGESRRDPR